VVSEATVAEADFKEGLNELKGLVLLLTHWSRPPRSSNYSPFGMNAAVDITSIKSKKEYRVVP
jgi:hypothetical protein